MIVVISIIDRRGKSARRTDADGKTAVIEEGDRAAGRTDRGEAAGGIVAVRVTGTGNADVQQAAGGVIVDADGVIRLDDLLQHAIAIVNVPRRSAGPGVTIGQAVGGVYERMRRPSRRRHRKEVPVGIVCEARFAAIGPYRPQHSPGAVVSETMAPLDLVIECD